MKANVDLSSTHGTLFLFKWLDYHGVRFEFWHHWNRKLQETVSLFQWPTATWILPGTHARKAGFLSAPLARREVTAQTLSVCLIVLCRPYAFIHAESKHRLLNCLCKYYLWDSWKEEWGNNSGCSSLQTDKMKCGVQT